MGNGEQLFSNLQINRVCLCCYLFDTNTERKKNQINCIGTYQNRNKYSPVGEGDASYNYKLQVTPGMFFLFHEEAVKGENLSSLDTVFSTDFWKYC